MKLNLTTDCLLRYTDVLTESEQQALLRLVEESEPKFKDSLIVKPMPLTAAQNKYRRSLILYRQDFEFFDRLFNKLITAEFPEICKQLQIPEFEIADTKIQLTAHNDGDYYLWHKDADGAVKNWRIITFVYYFHSLPKEFTGGELGVYPTDASPLLITPENNTIVFFDSSVLHDVKPVVCPSKMFLNGRFTLNGWIIKARG